MSLFPSAVVVFGRGQTIGHIAALAVSSRSSRRSYCVRQVGGAYAEPGQRGCPVPQDDQSAPPPIWRMRWRFTGANTKRSGGSPQLSPTKFVRADPRSRYGRKSGFLPQGDWLVHPVACPVRLGGAGSTGPPRVRHGGLPSPRIVPRCVAWWHRHHQPPVIAGVIGVNVLQLLHKIRQH